MADEIIEELWQAKDTIAQEADYDIDKLIAMVQKTTEKNIVINDSDN